MPRLHAFKNIKCDEIEEAMRIGAILKRIRFKHGLTGKEVSRILGLNDGDFVKIEQGLLTPKKDPYKFIVSVSDALRGIEPKVRIRPRAPMKGRKICNECYRTIHSPKCSLANCVDNCAHKE